MAEDVSENKAEKQEPKPKISVHDTDVDFAIPNSDLTVRYHVEIYSDYQWADFFVFKGSIPEGDKIPRPENSVKDEEKELAIAQTRPWIDKVFRECSTGSWGTALFNPQGMALIDEIGKTMFWTFPEEGKISKDTKITGNFSLDGLPREHKPYTLRDARPNEF